MRKRLLSTLLALALCLGLLPATAYAAEEPLPDWYFLFAIFKNVDADVKDGDGNITHQTYTMPQEEIDILRDISPEFEEYMNSLGVMCAHVDVVEIDTPITELYNEYSGGSYLDRQYAPPLLETTVDLDRYDHVFCILNLNVRTNYAGVTGSPIENLTGVSSINHRSWERFQEDFLPGQINWYPQLYSHEFLHYMEQLSRKWDADFNEHLILSNIYTPTDDNWKTAHTDMYLNRVKGNAETGTGVHPAVWQYPPHVLRTMTELTVPSTVSSIGTGAFSGYTSLTNVTIPTSVTNIGSTAFYKTGLTEITIPSSISRIEGATFSMCTMLTRVTIPASVTEIGNAAFYKTALTDIYYGGTEDQWKAIQIDKHNDPLTNAAIHYNSLMADVKTTDWFAAPVAWALENGIAGGTGGYKFSPKDTCTQGQILTFLWRSQGQPAPSGTAIIGTKYYAEAVQWAREQGLVGDDLSPDANCTRADVVTYLWKLADSPAAGSADFSDVPVGADYAQAVAWAVSQGITGGTGNGKFSPDSSCTRGEIVTFLYRALK